MNQPDGATARRGQHQALVVTLAASLLLLAGLELRFPYYFLQDDGLEYYLPAYEHNWRSLASGHLPLYNFHTFGGVPHASMGQTAVFYLPQYPALWLSHSIWHHPFTALEILGIMNGLLAVAGTFLLLKELGASNASAAFAGLASLSGFFLWFGRMWFNTTMLCAWFPWMAWAAVRFLSRPGWGRAGWLLAVRMALLYAGHSQYFTLAILFEHLFALSWLLISRTEKWPARSVRYLGLAVPTIALGLPLLLPLAAEVNRSLLRSSPLSYEMFSALRLRPIDWIRGEAFVFLPIPQRSNVFERAMPFLSYVGYVSVVLPFGLLWLWKKEPGRRAWVAAGVGCFAIALLWSWNIGGSLLYRIPLLNRFRFPFKLVYFAGFFQCFLAALTMTHLKERWQYALLAASVLNWAWVFLALPNHAWRIREYHPPLSSPWRDAIKDFRYLPISDSPVFYPWSSSGSNEFVELNYSLLWGFDNLFGYEPMHSDVGGRIALGNVHTGTFEGPPETLPMQHLKRWSVRYVLTSPARASFSPALVAAGFERRTARNGWTLWEDPRALPRIRWEGVSEFNDRQRGIEWVEHVNSIDVTLTQWVGKKLEVAFAANPGLQVCLEAACEPIQSSQDDLIHISVPPGQRHVRIVYRNPLYFPSILVATLTIVALCASGLYSRRRYRREHRPVHLLRSV